MASACEMPCFTTRIVFIASLLFHLPIVLPGSLCLERVSKISTLNFVGHPLSRSYAVIASKSGLIQLVKLPSVRSGKPVTVVSTWLNLTARVLDNGERGLLGIAFHPRYSSNGKFYVSYICDSTKFGDCQGPCACNKDIGCTLFKKRARCNSNTVIAEYRVKKWSQLLETPSAVESKRIMTYGRPYEGHNGGNIFFGKDGFFYITSGDGGSQGDPYNAAQSGRSFLGKVHRINVDSSSAGKNYSIPAGNPFVRNSSMLPEIYALGLRNPWRCGVDSVTGGIFCGDVGQDLLEEVDQLIAGRNYGWSRYEGTIVNKKKVKILAGTTLQVPLFQYGHFKANISGVTNAGFCVIGGEVYRGPRNSCLQGKYMYNDLGGAFWVATVYPKGKGEKPSTARVDIRCDPKSPVPCATIGGKAYVNTPWGWGTDGSRDVFVLAVDGIYRITDLSYCGIKC